MTKLYYVGSIPEGAPLYHRVLRENATNAGVAVIARYDSLETAVLIAKHLNGALSEEV